MSSDNQYNSSRYYFLKLVLVIICVSFHTKVMLFFTVREHHENQLFLSSSFCFEIYGCFIFSFLCGENITLCTIVLLFVSKSFQSFTSEEKICFFTFALIYEEPSLCYSFWMFSNFFMV